MKLALSLAGGGIKGVAHIGAIKALKEENIKFDIISGTSSGSIVSTLYASGFNTNEMYKIFKQYAKEINYFDLKNILKFFKDIIMFQGFKLDGLNSGENISKLVKNICSKKNIHNIKQIRMPIIIPAVNIYDEKLYIFTNCIKEKEEKNVVYINDADISTAVRASCSYPRNIFAM